MEDRLLNLQPRLDAVASGLAQQTLAGEIVRSGIGLHSGAAVDVRVLPAEVGQGRYFVRVDHPHAPPIPAHVDAVSQTLLSTELSQETAHVRTVEHLLAALFALGVDNARIELTAAEVPLLDGSAQDWVTAITEVGTVQQPATRSQISIAEPVWVREGDAFVAAFPAASLRFTYGIDFDLAAIGHQWHSWAMDATSFMTEIAPARTFGLAHQIEALRTQGLIQGGSLDNALVCGADGWINPPLRFANEPARHKLLDLVGDISLLGCYPVAHILAYKASHHLHVQLVRSLKALLACS